MAAVASGEGIAAEICGQAWQVVAGDCSGQVRRLNPGRDLLIAADWENLPDMQIAETLLPLMGVSLDVPRNVPDAPADEPAGAVSLLLLRTGLVLAFGILIVAVTGLVLRRRARSE